MPVNFFCNKIKDFYNEKTFDYAVDRFNQKDYYNAITEFERYIFFGTNKTNITKSKYMIGLCYLRGGNYKKAQEYFQSFLNYNGELQEEAYIRLADINFLSELEKVKIHNSYDYEPVYFYDEGYKKYLKEYKFGKYYDEAYLKLIIVNLLNLNYTEAKKLIKDYNTDEKIIGNLKFKIDEINKIRSKSKSLAVILSIFFPGMGQVYAGEVKEGLIAFLVNVSVASFAIYSYKNYSKLLGVLAGYYELSFYLGNIKNSINAVEKYNENSKNKYRISLINLYIKYF